MISRLEKGAKDAVEAMSVGKQRCEIVLGKANRTNQSLRTSTSYLLK